MNSKHQSSINSTAQNGLSGSFVNSGTSTNTFSISAHNSTQQRSLTSHHQVSQSTFSNNTQIKQEFRAFIRVMDNFMDRFSDEIKETFDIPKLVKNFKALNWKYQIALILGIIAVTGLIGWATWELIAWLYPRINKFLESERGQKLLTELEPVLTKLQSLDFISIFVTYLNQANSSAADQMNSGVVIEEVDLDCPIGSESTLVDIANSNCPIAIGNSFISSIISFLQQRMSI